MWLERAGEFSWKRTPNYTHLFFRFDSIPSDLGIDYLKRNFEGTLGYVEAFLSNNFGPSVSDFKLYKFRYICFRGTHSAQLATTRSCLVSLLWMKTI